MTNNTSTEANDIIGFDLLNSAIKDSIGHLTELTPMNIDQVLQSSPNHDLLSDEMSCPVNSTEIVRNASIPRNNVDETVSANENRSSGTNYEVISSIIIIDIYQLCIKPKNVNNQF